MGGLQGLLQGPGAGTSRWHLPKHQQRCPVQQRSWRPPARQDPWHGDTPAPGMVKGRKMRGGKLEVKGDLGHAQEGGGSGACIPPLAPMPCYGQEQQAALAKPGERHKLMLLLWESNQIPPRGMSPGSSACRPLSLTRQ